MHIKKYRDSKWNEKIFENSEIIQKGENTNMHTYSLFLSLSLSLDDIMFINHNSILSGAPTDLQL